MGELRAPLAEGQRDPIDDSRMERIAARLHSSELGRPAATQRPMLVWATSGAVIVCFVFAVWLVIGNRETGSPRGIEAPSRSALANTEAREETPTNEEIGEDLRLDFADGSRVLLDEGADLRTARSTKREVLLVLSSGAARFDVNPETERRWTIDAGLAQVVVVGTRFRVERSSDRVEVAVERGTVRVEGHLVPEGRRIVRGGHSIVIVRTSGEERLAAGDSDTTSVEPGDAAAPSPRRPTERIWRPLARRGAFDEAYDALGKAGVRRETHIARSVDDLFLLADVARRSGHPRDAVAPLERIIEHHSSDDRAGLASFTLGRLHLGVLGQPRRARNDFQRSIALGIPPALSEDAHARLVEASARCGDRTGARDAAREYSRRFPGGRLETSVRSWAGLEAQ